MRSPPRELAVALQISTQNRSKPRRRLPQSAIKLAFGWRSIAVGVKLQRSHTAQILSLFSASTGFQAGSIGAKKQVTKNESARGVFHGRFELRTLASGLVLSASACDETDQTTKHEQGRPRLRNIHCAVEITL